MPTANNATRRSTAPPRRSEETGPIPDDLLRITFRVGPGRFSGSLLLVCGSLLGPVRKDSQTREKAPRSASSSRVAGTSRRMPTEQCSAGGPPAKANALWPRRSYWDFVPMCVAANATADWICPAGLRPVDWPRLAPLQGFQPPRRVLAFPQERTVLDFPSRFRHPQVECPGTCESKSGRSAFWPLTEKSDKAVRLKVL